MSDVIDFDNISDQEEEDSEDSEEGTGSLLMR